VTATPNIFIHLQCAFLCANMEILLQSAVQNFTKIQLKHLSNLLQEMYNLHIYGSWKDTSNEHIKSSTKIMWDADFKQKLVWEQLCVVIQTATVQLFWKHSAGYIAWSDANNLVQHKM
jgi:hypothetical protein